MAFLDLLTKVRHNINAIVKNQGYENVNFSVDASKPGFGDITCNVAFLLSKQLKPHPHDISKIISSLYPIERNSEIKNVTAHPQAILILK